MIASFLALFSLINLTWATHAQFAIFDPLDRKDGVWSAESEALSIVLKKMGYAVQIIEEQDLLARTYPFDVLIQPGGIGNPRVKRIGAEGFARIKEFVRKGGGYVGFCAGSYLATGYWDFAYESTRLNGKMTDPDDYEQFIITPIASLFEGWAVGPFAWHPWNHGTTPASLEPVKMGRKVVSLFYYGGPYFDFEQKPQGLEVWARAIAPENTPQYAKDADGQPTIVKFNLDEGNVVLSSYHPVFTIKDRKRVIVEPKSESWNLLQRIFRSSLGK